MGRSDLSGHAGDSGIWDIPPKAVRPGCRAGSRNRRRKLRKDWGAQGHRDMTERRAGKEKRRTREWKGGENFTCCSTEPYPRDSAMPKVVMSIPSSGL